ncbi:MAG: prepilin-type N-terminal cleavage/methylation domain-containing protein [Candidatus Sumerlaeia bacterium]|nr:prepilin-type N-terminal cleavage/methylation domain-containing protein [Candidatus Sumerlaeia bacterium]
MKKQSGFTLIELLIVVAIIAILAAIAIPNFLEAQVRSKVSRIKSDLRSLATAMEAYYVDWNSYTWRDQGDDPTYVEGFCQLTTPIAYITSIPRDPFGEHRYYQNMSRRDPMLELGTGRAGVASSGAKWTNSNGMPSDVWEMCSAGPDHIDDTSANSQGFGITLTEGQFPWPSLADDAKTHAAISGLCYDPTNGTVSGGQVYKSGGSPLPGMWGSIFMNNGR